MKYSDHRQFVCIKPVIDTLYYRVLHFYHCTELRRSKVAWVQGTVIKPVAADFYNHDGAFELLSKIEIDKIRGKGIT